MYSSCGLPWASHVPEIAPVFVVWLVPDLYVHDREYDPPVATLVPPVIEWMVFVSFFDPDDVIWITCP